MPPEPQGPGRRGPAYWWRHPQGGGGGSRLNCRTQWEEGVPRYGSAASREEGGEPPDCVAQGGGGAPRYSVGGFPREEEGEAA